MKLTRRNLLKASLGVGQLALLEKLGVPMLSKRSRAAEPGSGPTKLLTVYIPGGWVPFYLWCPFTPAEIATYIPPKGQAIKEPLYYDANDVTNLDGSGDATDGAYLKLRGPELWDEAALSAGQSDPRNGTSPHGWAWKEYQLWEDASVVHGVDMMTAAHQSGLVSMLSGKASATFQVPSVHAWTAWATNNLYNRPLPSVAVGSAPSPNPAFLTGSAAPTLMPTLGALDSILSEAKNPAWQGLRNRGSHPQFDFAGNPVSPELTSNTIEEMVLTRTRAMAGTTNNPTEAFYEKLYDGYRDVSRLLAQDLVTTISQQEGVLDSSVLAQPHWIPSNWSFFGSDIGGGVSSDSGSGVNGDIDLALKLLRSNLTTAVSLQLKGVGNFFFDTHGDHSTQFVYLRAVYDVLGRLLAQMKYAPGGGGKSLLEDTLVIVTSEFGRTWPTSGSCDHWPGNSVMFAGGGVQPNRQIGRYAISGLQPGLLGFMGDPVDCIIEGTSSAAAKNISSADVVYTALHHMGALEQPEKAVTITGGVGRIAGLEQA